VPSPWARQVIVKVCAVSLNYHDLVVIKGLYNPRLPLPRVPLSDGAGDVVAAGDEVSRIKVGDRVTSIFMSLHLQWKLYLLKVVLSERRRKSALPVALKLTHYQQKITHKPLLRPNICFSFMSSLWDCSARYSPLP